MSEENRALALRASEIVNQKNPDLIEELYPPDFVWHGPAGDIRGYELAKQLSSTFFAAFPDARITDEDLIAEGEKVVRRYTTRGTHQGQTEMFGPPTGRQIEQKGITIHRIGSSTVNRGQAARSASNSHRGFLPRHLGSSAGGTGYLNSSSVDQR